MSIKIELLPAFNGDCILIRFNDSDNKVRNILIDGGIPRTYPKHLKARLQKIKDRNENIDLLIITHIDNDHIGGIIKLFEDNKFDKSIIKKVWYNSEKNISKKYPTLIDNPSGIELADNINTQTSTRQALTLEKELKKLKCWEDDVIEVNDKFKELDLFGIKLTVLTPNFEGILALNKKLVREIERDRHTASADNDYNISIDELLKNDFDEDDSDTNKSSIAFVLEDKDCLKYLFLGDSHPSDINIALKKLGYNEENKIKIEYLKLSHHGSKRNLSEDLLKIINCKKFILSSDGTKNGHPSKECLSRIINSNQEIELNFNYDIYRNIFSPSEMKENNIKCYFKRILEV